MCLGEFSVKPIQPVACYRVAARKATSNPIRPGASAPAKSYFTDFLEEREAMSRLTAISGL